MAVFSKFRPSDANLAYFSATYATHRPLIQRCLTSGFVLYVLSTTYRGLSVRPSKSARKGHKGGDGKAPRVAVSSTDLDACFVT
jgi:ATP-binding cassette subfamily D (ALD) long-chain fatty acid import protein